MAGLSAPDIRRGLTHPTTWDLRVFDEVASTNTLALDLADAGAPERTVLLADSQTAGRGRAGREWRTPDGTALAFSMIVRPRCETALWPWVGLLAAFAVRDAIEQLTGLSGLVKWPNDVLISGRKVAGVLTEAHVRSSGALGAALVVGIGVNVNNRAAALPQSFREVAASILDLSGKVTDRNRLATQILNGVDAAIRALPHSAEDIRARWPNGSSTFGAPVTLSTPGGLVEGRDQGLDPIGRLIVLTPGGARHISSGEVLQLRTIPSMIGQDTR